MYIMIKILEVFHLIMISNAVLTVLSLDCCTACQFLCILTDHPYLHQLWGIAGRSLTTISFPQEKISKMVNQCCC